MLTDTQPQLNDELTGMAGDHEFIVLAYGDSPHLGDCLSSLKSQTRSTKISVTTSTPSTYIERMAAAYDAPLHVNRERASIASDWNFGLSQATMPYVTLAHQDDIYYPRFVELSTDLLRTHPSAAMCFTGYEEIVGGIPSSSTKVVLIKKMIRSLFIGQRRVIGCGLRQRALLAFGSTIPCPTVTINRTVLGNFRFQNEFSVNLDWHAWWQMHLAGHSFLSAEETLVAHRIDRLTETSKSKADGRRALEDRAMFAKIWPAPFNHALAMMYRLGY